MTQDTRPGLQECDCERVFASPVARAVVRTIVQRRGVTEAQARQIYLDYINRTQPGREHWPCPAAEPFSTQDGRPCAYGDPLTGSGPPR